MSLNAAAIRLMADKGMSASDIAEIAEAMEIRRDPTATERKRRQRERERDMSRRDVTRDPLKDSSIPPSSEPNGSKKREGRARQKIPLPEGWQPAPLTPGSITAAIVAAWPVGRLERELSKFRDHAVKTGNRWSDWDAAWRGWIQRTTDFEGRTNGQQPSSQHGLRGNRPDPALDMLKRAIAEEAAGRDPAPDRGTGLALPAIGSG